MPKNKDSLDRELSSLKEKHNKLFRSFKEDEIPNLEELEEHCKEWRDLHRKTRKRYKSRDSVGADAVIHAEASWRRGTSLAALAEAKYESKSINGETAIAYVERAKEYLEESSNIYEETSESKQVKGIQGDIKSVNKFIAKLPRKEMPEHSLEANVEIGQDLSQIKEDISSVRISAAQMNEINGKKRRSSASSVSEEGQGSFVQRHEGQKKQRTQEKSKPVAILRTLAEKIESRRANQESGNMQRF